MRASNNNGVGIGYQAFQTRVKLVGTLTLLSGLHIGQGRALEPAASELPVLKDWGGRPFIPGSSLKGVLRSNLEAWLRGLFPQNWRHIACDRVGGGEVCINNERKQQIIQQHRDNLPEADRLLWKESCWICRFFGSPWLASKVQVLDLSVKEWRPEQLMVRDGVVIDRESETAASKLKYDFEVVPPGTTFRLQLLVENPDPWEMGLLMVGFDLLNEGYALLGGDTSRGLGRVRVDWEEIRTVTPQQLLEELPAETEAEPRAEERSNQLPEEVRTEPVSGSERESKEEAADPIKAVVASLQELGGTADHEALVAAMRERGWTKQRLQEAFQKEKGFNWKQLFERAVKEGRMVEVEGRYALPGVPRATLSQATKGQGGEAEIETEGIRRSREAIEQQILNWKKALKQRIQEERNKRQEGEHVPNAL
jgi:CRISPR-associated RAMP protein (TIGR02581 family)